MSATRAPFLFVLQVLPQYINHERAYFTLLMDAFTFS